MAIGHISIRVHTRSKGHSAAAGLAYRMGVDLVDPRTGVEHLYARRTRHGDIVDCGMSGAGLFGDVAALAAAIEAAEKRKNSTLMRDVQIALPWELNDEQCVALTSEFSALLARRYCTHTAWSVHRPDKRGDARNKHGHIAVPTRELDAVGGGFGKKLRILDEHKTGRIEVAEIRHLWEERANTHLERAGHASRVYVGRRDDGNPVPTLGAGCTALEREAAEDRGEAVENRSVADLVSTGEAVTWRGKALRRHQLGAKQQARQEERASALADEQEIAAVTITTSEPWAVAAPARVGFEVAPRTLAANGLREARPEAVATPAPVDTKQRKASGRVQRVHEVQVDAVAEPMKPIAPARRWEGARAYEVRVHAIAAPARIARRPQTSPRPVTVRAAAPAPVVRPTASGRQEMPRRRRGAGAHGCQVQTIARPVRVRLDRASPSPSIPAGVAQARPKAVAEPQRPSVRFRPAASPVRVRPVQVAVRPSPQEQDLSALETPPSLQEIANRLYEEVYAGEDAGAAGRPADPRRGLAIGYANWSEVLEVAQRDSDLCGNVAALAAGRAADEGKQNYSIHQSWAGRIADWIREHVAAALELIGLRRRQASHLARRQTAESIAPSLGVDPNALYAVEGLQGEDRLVALETTCYARAIGFPIAEFETIYTKADAKRRGSGYRAVWEECVRRKAREEVRKALPFEASDRARPGALVVAVSGGPSRELLQQVADDEFVHGIVSEQLAASAGSAEQRAQAEDFYHRRRTDLEYKKLQQERGGWFSSNPTREEAKQAVLERFLPELATRVRKACAVRDLGSLMARTVEEDRARRAGDALASALPQWKPYQGSSSQVAVSDERFDRIASRTGNAVIKEFIATRFLEGASTDAYGRSQAEKDYLGPRIRRKKEEQSGLRQEQAEAAVHKEYEEELLRRMEAVCREVQQWSAAEIWGERAPSKATPSRPAFLPPEANRHVGVDRPAAPSPGRGTQEKRGWEPGSR